jgi:lysophospholipase L1-like esterase
MARILRQKFEILTVAVACLPCCLFFCWFSVSVIDQKSVAFSRGDLVICWMVVLLLLSICWFRNRFTIVSRVALLQWALLLVLFPVEIGMRILYRQPPAPWYPNTIREITLTVPLQGVARSGTFTTNELGLRGRPFGVSSLRSSRLSILCIGGSTTECFYNSDDSAWPAMMETVLTSKMGDGVLVGNAGRGGHIAKHHARQLQQYRYAAEFDVVVVLCGWNDLAAVLFGNPGDPPRDIAAEALTGGVDFSASAEPHAPFYRNLATGRLLQQAVLRRPWDSAAMIGWRAVSQDPYGEWIAKRRAVRQRSLEAGSLTEEPQGFEAALIAYREDLQAIKSALVPGQTLVFVTQPTLCRAGLNDEQQGRLWSCDGKRAWTPESTADMLTRVNRVMRAFFDEQGIVCVDAEAVLSGNPDYFYDDCHFSDVGCAALAELVSEKVLVFTAAKSTAGAR